MIALSDGDGDGVFRQTPLDATGFVDRIVGWAVSYRLVWLEFASQGEDGYAAGFTIEELRNREFGYETRPLGQGHPIPVDLFVSADAACMGLDLRPVQFGGDVWRELGWVASSFGRGDDGESLVVSYWPYDEVPRTCPGGRIPVDWSSISCEPLAPSRWRYTVELRYPIGPPHAACGAVQESCVLETDAHLPDSWAECR